jgi:hypothetical protein
LRQREIFVAQLGLLDGNRNPFDGAADYLIFTNSAEAKKALNGWIKEIDTMLGLDDADRT